MAEFNPNEERKEPQAQTTAGAGPSVGARPLTSLFSMFSRLLGGGAAANDDRERNPEAAAELGGQWAEGSAPVVETPAKRAEDQQKKADTKADALPASEKTEQKAQLDLEAKAHDPNTSLSDGEVEKLAEQADPQKMKPEDVLKMRGISPAAIDTIRNSGSLDTQETVKSGDPDMVVGRGADQRNMTPEEVAASHKNREGAVLPAMTGEQKTDTVAAQAALSEDMTVGAEVRKAVPMDSAAKMLAGATGDPSMFGDFGLKRNTEGQTPMEATATLGLDYQGSPYVKPGADGKMTFSDTVKNEGLMMIDSVMTPEMLAKAQVPLGHDVMGAAQQQAAALAEQKKTDPGTVVPPLLELGPDGKMLHAFERNRTGPTDPRTGAGNSTVEHKELLTEAEAQRPGDQVNVVNQEMKIGGAKGGAVPLPGGKDEKGENQSQMNLVQPDGTVVNVANVVPVTDPDGNPVYQKNEDGSVKKDDKGNPLPKTRWALNIKPPEEGGMPPELKETWMERVHDAHQAHVAAVTKKREEAAAAGKPLPPMPDPIPELQGYTPRPKAGAAS